MTEEEWTNINYSESTNFALLTWHCFKKGVQLGSVIGNVIVTPIVLFRQYKQTNSIQQKKMNIRYHQQDRCHI